MTDKARIKIAAIVTALFLAGICAAGLAVRDGQPQAAATAAAPATAPDAAAGESTSGEDRSVAAILEGVLAAVSGEEHEDDD